MEIVLVLEVQVGCQTFSNDLLVAIIVVGDDTFADNGLRLSHWTQLIVSELGLVSFSAAHCRHIFAGVVRGACELDRLVFRSLLIFIAVCGSI